MEDSVMKKILIVDDNEVHLVIAENILKEKYKISTAKSGKDALALLSKGYIPNLILLDILMPDMDGWETFNKIKGISLLRNVSIIFLTSLDGAREKIYASRIGAADLITKPYNGDELKKRIDNLLESRTG